MKAILAYPHLELKLWCYKGPMTIILLSLVTLGGCTLQEPSNEVHTVQETLSGTHLLDTQWQLESIGGVMALSEVEATLVFEEGQVRGNGSCNNFGGPFSLEGDRLTFGPIMSTVMACEEAVMQQETNYFQALEQVRRFRLTEDQLVLYSQDDTALLYFRPMK